MTIEIDIGPSAEKDETDEQIESTDATMEMVIRKTLDGNYLIKDHIDVDIMVIPDESKILVLPKEKQVNSDIVYSTQDRLFTYLRQKGIINPDSVEGGDAYFSMQATYPESSTDMNPTQAVVFTIGKFLEEEEPFMKFDQEHEDQMTKWFTRPDDEHSTELGEVPQDGQQGASSDGLAPFGQYYRLWESSYYHNNSSEDE